jgi:hypothetical protein
VMPCSVVVGYHCFTGPGCLHLQAEVTDDGKNCIDLGLECRRMPAATSQ